MKETFKEVENEIRWRSIESGKIIKEIYIQIAKIGENSCNDEKSFNDKQNSLRYVVITNSFRIISEACRLITELLVGAEVPWRKEETIK